MTLTKSACGARRAGSMRTRPLAGTFQSPVAFIYWDTALRITEWSGAAEEIFGYSSTEVLGRSGFEWLFFDEVPAAFFDGARGVENCGEVNPSGFKTAENVSKRGERFVCEWFNAPTFDEHGNRTGTSSLVLKFDAASVDHDDACRGLAHGIDEVMFRVDADGCWRFLSRAWTRITGYAVEDCIGKSFTEVLCPDYYDRAVEIFERAVRGAKIRERYEVGIVSGDGDVLTMELRVRVIRDGGGVAFIGTLTDVTHRRKIAHYLDEQDAFLRGLIDASPNAVFVTDEDGVFRLVNRAAARLYGLDPSRMIGRCEEELGNRHLPFMQRNRRTPSTEEISVVDASGRQRWYRLTHEPVHLPGADMRLILGTAVDITDRKRLERELAFNSLHDSLTGLPNRTLLADCIDRSVAATRVAKNCNAVMLFDIDNFNLVNDAMGHDIGDEMLMEFAQRLECCLRPGDTVARIGGDEFAILLENLSDETDAVEIAECVIKGVMHPIFVGGREVVPAVSVGIAVGRSGMSAEMMMRNAHTAMFQAKSSGKATYVLFRDDMNARAVERLDLEAEFRKAIVEGQIVLHYQPIVDVKTGKVEEVEALARWTHPDRGPISPSTFIPLAEQTGLIVPFGRWVIRQACRDRRQWVEESAAADDLIVAVNVSLRQMQEPDFVDQVAAILKETGTPPTRLRIEITETVMMVDVDNMIAMCRALKRLGVGIAIDDFGTGYSSMAYLLRLPVDTMKIDRFFTSQIGGTPEEEVVVRSIVGLARSLGMRVTCEGVETERQLSTLASVGADCIQGYYLARPQPFIDAAFKSVQYRP